MEQVDTSLLGYGLSDAAGSAILQVPRNNLGGARFDDTADHGLPLVTGDELLAGRDFDFMKIDVEGMELKCLAGLSETIGRCRPRIFIEVDNENVADFQAWVDENAYEIVHALQALRVERELSRPAAALSGQAPIESRSSRFSTTND